MARLSTSERTRLTALALDKLRRQTLSRALYSPLLKWRYGAAIADQLLIVPQDLRTADPSFWHEMEIGQFGLAGCLAVIDDQSPFGVAPPSEGWAHALHGFTWLRHLAATDEKEARTRAQELVLEWISQVSSSPGVHWQADITARRLISWITYAPFLLDGTDARTYDTIAESLGLQIVRLSATWRDAPPGHPRLLALIAVTLADLSVANHERRLPDAERLLSEELEKQILADGGHVSRDTSVLVELMLDLLPLSHCFKARERPQPDALSLSIRRGLAMLRYMRMGDGLLARFNGTGAGSAAGLATVLAYDDVATGEVSLSDAPQSRYARLFDGKSILICDVGAPPPLEYASQCHAGALSFEMSIGKDLIFINGGAPSHAEAEWRPAARATAAHNTLRLGEKSSSKLVRHKLFADLVGAMPIRFPTRTECKLMRNASGQSLTASHDGYVSRLGLVHHRGLRLSNDGRRLEGLDKIEAPGTPLRLRTDLPFSIHFHLHPDVRLDYRQGADQVSVTLPDGSEGAFSASGASLNVEDSIYYADTAGATRTQQIVLRGATFGDSTVRWAFSV